MKPTEFCYWLQGFFELSQSTQLSEKQVQMIKNHLAMVFYHEIDPSYTKDVENSEKHQEILNELHDGGSSIKPHHLLPPGVKFKKDGGVVPPGKLTSITSQQVTDADSKAWPEDLWPLNKK